MDHSPAAPSWPLPRTLGAAHAQASRFSRVRQVVTLLDKPGALEACDSALLAQPAFADLYARRARTPEALESPPQAPADSLARVHRDFLAWYGLRPGFFPASDTGLEAMRPTAFASHLLGWAHDGLHVLTAYETSDIEEVALQSFLFAQAPVVFGWFIRDMLTSPALADTLRYKHLYDVLDSPLDAVAVQRGLASALLLAFPFEEHWLAPLESLRQRWQVPPRTGTPPAARFGNTCGGRGDAPFFSSPLTPGSS